MAEESKNCPDCGSPMKLDKRPKPEGATGMFVGKDYWVCTKCSKVIEIED